MLQTLPMVPLHRPTIVLALWWRQLHVLFINRKFRMLYLFMKLWTINVIWHLICISIIVRFCLIYHDFVIRQLKGDHKIYCHIISHKMFCELTKCCKIILLPKIVTRLSYDHLWIWPLMTIDESSSVFSLTWVSQSAHQGTERHSVTAVIGCSVSRCAVQTHWYRQTILQLRCTCNLELSASCCHQLWHSLCV